MFKAEDVLFHTLNKGVTEDLPKRFTYPFYYQPHPLCVSAVEDLKAYLKTQIDFEHNFGLDNTKQGLKIGKMFGVMLVKSNDDALGYIVAFSGKLAESNFLKGFVPPIYDTLKTDGFYKQGEAKLNALNAEIEALEASESIQEAILNLETVKAERLKTIEAFKQNAKKEKKKRQQTREQVMLIDSAVEKENVLESLKQQSIQSNLELKYLKEDFSKKTKQAEQALHQLQVPIVLLKQERKALSASLQRQIHEQYQFLNAKGEIKDLINIFDSTNLAQPPAAAGECAAPKLFQYAYENNLKPIAMAEFWWGSSPKSEVRKHGQFYPSCRGKCEPILGHMMQGLDVEPNPMEATTVFKKDLEILYEDDYLLLVNKPHEFLSVPGKIIKDSVLTRMQTYLPDAKGPLLVHRLDMSTSGILLIAKNEKTHKNLQKQFINRTIKKHYVALLDGILQSVEGEINLPLRVDFNNRPRQLVCYEHGKPSKTKYKVVSVGGGKTRIHFYPITGRTHQLRVHAAHQLGLNLPIVGDDLYGNTSNRLHLHAESLSFEHPVKGEVMTITCNAPF